MTDEVNVTTSGGVAVAPTEGVASAGNAINQEPTKQPIPNKSNGEAGEQKVILPEIEVKQAPVPASSRDQSLSEESSSTLSVNPIKEEIPLENKNKMMYLLGIIFSVLFILGLVGLYAFRSGLPSAEVNVLVVE